MASANIMLSTIDPFKIKSRTWSPLYLQIGKLVQERRDDSALAKELRLCCTNPPSYP